MPCALRLPSLVHPQPTGRPALPLQLSLRSINSAHTAFMSVSYAATFFDSYDVYNCDVVQAGLFLKVCSCWVECPAALRWPACDSRPPSPRCAACSTCCLSSAPSASSGFRWTSSRATRGRQSPCTATTARELPRCVSRWPGLPAAVS